MIDSEQGIIVRSDMSENVFSMAIDLGGKTTGAFLCQYDIENGITPSGWRREGLVITLNERDQTWKQSDRTQRRHQVRGYKRRKMAKRLLKLIVTGYFGWTPTLSQWEELNGLLNRRGFTYLTVDEDQEDCSVNISPRLLHQTFPEIFDPDCSLDERLRELSREPKELRRAADMIGPANIEEVLSHLADNDLEEKTDIKKGFKDLQDMLKSLVNALEGGHKSRREYFEAIRKDLLKSKELAPLWTPDVSRESFTNLVGHLSNLQLRCLRHYFNDSSMRVGDSWNERRLADVFFRWVRGWHCRKEVNHGENQAELLKQDGAPSIVRLFMDMDPALSIPPYEDQNNRRPPLDSTLLLSPGSLDTLFPSWRDWADSFQRKHPDLAERLDNICKHQDRKQAIGCSIADRRQAYFLHRLLDRSMALDEYSLRRLARFPEGRDLPASMEHPFRQLVTDVGSRENAMEFLQMARKYYAESNQARDGLWSEADDNLLTRSGIHPRQKRKINHILIGAIIGKVLTPSALEDFKQNCWNKPAVRRLTLRGACKRIEETRKRYGNSFNEVYSSELALLTRGEGSSDPKLRKIAALVQPCVKAIAAFLGHGETRAAAYENPFSLAQIYNLLETDVHGFSRTSIAVALENSWRSEVAGSAADGRQVAHARRLPADSIRPFDGMLARMLDAQSRLLAGRMFTFVRAGLPSSCDSLLIPLVIEQNQFTFSEGLAQIKRQARKAKAAATAGARFMQAWSDKSTRIKAASCGVCPYTGLSIAAGGEIDHIIPRSLSRDFAGTIFNSEANLIYCSNAGNKSKSNKLFGMENLHADYLCQVFGHADRKAITDGIKRVVGDISQNRSFMELDADQQKALRHALFMPGTETFRAAVAMLSTQQRARVNGTQAWLCKRIRKHLRTMLESEYPRLKGEIRFIVYQARAEDVSRLRSVMSETNDRWSKEDQQPPGSHIQDAVCAWMTAANDPHFARVTGLLDFDSESESSGAALLPAEIRITPVKRMPIFKKHNPESVSLFKEGIYGERFVPILLIEKGLLVGFSRDNAARVTGRDEEIERYFELLKPFLLFRGQRVTGLLAEWRSRRNEEGRDLYFEIEKVKAIEHLFRAAKETMSSDEIAQADLLDVHHYTVQKQDIRKALYDMNKKSFNNAEEVLNEKLFETKIEYVKGQPFKMKGNVALPFRKEWERLLTNPNVNAVLGQSKPDFDESTWREIEASLFTRNLSERAHSPVRKVFSLPVRIQPSGELFRVKRRDSNGREIYQMVAAKGSPSSGFVVENGNINLNKVSHLPVYRDSPGLAPRGGRFRAQASEQIVRFDEWLAVRLPGKCAGRVTRLELCPGTKQRMYARIHMPFEEFRRTIAPALKDGLGGSVRSFWDLPFEMKLEDQSLFREQYGAIFGKPRGSMFLESAGTKIVFRYEADSKLPTAYQEAYREISGV